jgi:KaiC/GvpD/RAD55 family RecA-like ATPase
LLPHGVSGDDGDEMEIEGVITKIDTVNGIIELNGQVINIPAGMDISSFAVDDLVEIEVRVAVDGSLIAEEIEAEDAHDDDEDFTVEGLVEVIDAVNGTITVDGKVISIDKLNAIMIDHGEMQEKYFNIDSLAVGDWVELEVYIDDAGNYVAIKVERIKAKV